MMNNNIEMTVNVLYKFIVKAIVSDIAQKQKNREERRVSKPLAELRDLLEEAIKKGKGNQTLRITSSNVGTGAWNLENPNEIASFLKANSLNELQQQLQLVLVSSREAEQKRMEKKIGQEAAAKAKGRSQAEADARAEAAAEDEEAEAAAEDEEAEEAEEEEDAEAEAEKRAAAAADAEEKAAAEEEEAEDAEAEDSELKTYSDRQQNKVLNLTTDPAKVPSSVQQSVKTLNRIDPNASASSHRPPKLVATFKDTPSPDQEKYKAGKRQASMKAQQISKPGSQKNAPPEERTLNDLQRRQRESYNSLAKLSSKGTIEASSKNLNWEEYRRLAKMAYEELQDNIKQAKEHKEGFLRYQTITSNDNFEELKIFIPDPQGKGKKQEISRYYDKEAQAAKISMLAPPSDDAIIVMLENNHHFAPLELQKCNDLESMIKIYEASLLSGIKVSFKDPSDQKLLDSDERYMALKDELKLKGKEGLQKYLQSLNTEKNPRALGSPLPKDSHPHL